MWSIGVIKHKTNNFVSIVASIVDSKSTTSSVFAVFDSSIVVIMHSHTYNFADVVIFVDIGIGACFSLWGQTAYMVVVVTITNTMPVCSV